MKDIELLRAAARHDLKTLMTWFYLKRGQLPPDFARQAAVQAAEDENPHEKAGPAFA